MEPGGRDWLEDRIRGCLAFAALGDAAGEPVEGCTRDEVAAYGQPLAPLRHEALEWRMMGRTEGRPVWHFEGGGGGGAGAEVTDDTGQVESLVRALVQSGGDLTREAWRAALVEWFRDSPTAERAGPTARAALAGEGAGRSHDDRVGVTNGSAMRAAPCGLVHGADPASAVELAWLTSRVTHDTQVAAAAAGAIAAGVAIALRPGSNWADVAEACVLGAGIGNGLGVREGRTVQLPRVSARIELAVDQARAATTLDEALDRIEAAVGTSMLAFESVPAAVGVFVAVRGEPFAAVEAAVRIGGDTDTMASMAGALAGALHGYVAHEPEDRALLEHVMPPTLAKLVPGLAEVAARR